MCGLISILSTGRPVEHHRLKKAADTLIHRGPDGEGYWISPDGRVGLGHRRLSIIGLKTGAQPLHNENNNIHVIVNGEFYGFEDIRRSLQSKGHRFSTESDSEIALHLYEEYGLDFVHHLRGEFALVLYDQDNGRLVAVRDRFGIKPLCYAQNNNEILIASEAKALFAAGYGAAWDQYALFHACNMQYTPADSTLFAGIRQLLPGHILIHENNSITIKKYWDLDYLEEPLQNRWSDIEWIERFSDTFEETVRLRLRADVPVCFHLSGGIDSSAVAATAMKILGRALTCFTVRFDDPAYDEYPVAAEMAQKMGAPIHTVPVSYQDMVSCIPDAVYYSEGLAINGHLAGKFLLNKAIQAAGFKVALTGEGADELLAGYPHLRDDLINNSDASQEHKNQLYKSNDKLAGVFLPQGDMLSTNAVAKMMGYVPSFLQAKASLGFRMVALLSDDFKKSMADRDIYDDFAKSFDGEQLVNRHPVNQSSYLWTKSALALYILRTLGDGCEMAHSVEGRLPFLDHKLFELTRNMPIRLKIRDMTEKYILRESMKPLLTETVYKRQKHPFIAPPNPILDGFIQDTLRSQSFKNMNFFNSSKVGHWIDQLHLSSVTDRVAAEPVLMMIASTFFIQQKFAL